MMKRAILIFLLIVLCNSVYASDHKGVSKLVDAKALEPASIGFCVMNLKNGKIEAEHGLNQAIITASTMKTITSATALELLGRDFRFHTDVMYTGVIDAKGVLDGDIIIRGGGDPTLGSRHIKRTMAFADTVAEIIKKQGIRRIKGSVVADCSLLNGASHTKTWMLEDVGWEYGTGCYAINYKDNAAKVILSSGKEGTMAKLKDMSPIMPVLSVKCNVISANKDSICVVYKYGEAVLHITGKMKAGVDKEEVIIANPNPELSMIDDVKEALSKRDIEINYSPETKDSEPVLLLQYKSPALPQIIRSLLFRSDNMYTESLLQAISVVKTGSADREKGLQVVYDYWKERNMPINHLFMYDGSGLSSRNCASPYLFASILRYMAEKSVNKDIYYTLFPSFKDKNYDKTFFGNKKIKGDLLLKSGSMTKVLCYVGYYTKKNKPEHAVVILVNNYNCSNAELRQYIGDALLNTLKL